MKIKSILLGMLVCILLQSCATGYIAIKPSERLYTIKNENQGVLFNYQTDVLSKKYRKKEMNSGTSLVSVKIVNKSGRDLIFGENLQLFLGENQIEPFHLDHIYEIDKQKVLFNLFYLFLTPTNLYNSTAKSDGNTYTSSKSIFPIGLIVGPGLFLTNFIIGTSANNKFKGELIQYNLVGKSIAKDSTVYGIIGIKQQINQTLSMRITP